MLSNPKRVAVPLVLFAVASHGFCECIYIRVVQHWQQFYPEDYLRGVSPIYQSLSRRSLEDLRGFSLFYPSPTPTIVATNVVSPNVVDNKLCTDSNSSIWQPLCRGTGDACLSSAMSPAQQSNSLRPRPEYKKQKQVDNKTPKSVQ